MKTSQFIGAAVLSILGVATGAQAETYQGVQTIHSVASRAEVATQARAAARLGDQYSEASYGGVAPALNASADRSVAQRGAVQAAQAGNLYGDQASAGVLSVGRSNVDRATVRAEARATARSNVAAL
jgi:hypothetical protein